MGSGSTTTLIRADARARLREDGRPRPVDRVLFVASDLSDDSFGHSVLRLGRELRRRGKDVGLVCGGGALAGEFAGIGMPPLVVERLRGPRGGWWLPRGLVSAARAFAPDLIQLFGSSLAGWGARLSRAVGRPYVVAVMAFPPATEQGQLQGNWKRGSVLTLSEELREHLVNRWRVPKGIIGVVPIGIALEDYERYCDTGKEERTPVVGTVGPLTPERGCDCFLRAAGEIAARGHDVHFLVAGDGPEREPLRRLVRELDIQDRVTLVHHFPDYRQMIGVLDICVIPSLREGLGLNIIEAMACRRPVVATGVGAVYNVVTEGETGFLAPKGDHKVLAETILRLVEDRATAARIVEAAYKLVRDEFAIQGSVERLLEFYAKSLGRMEST